MSKLVPLSPELKALLRERGVETLFAPNQVRYPGATILEPPLSLKWMRPEFRLQMDAFSYAVSGYFCAVEIGRYCSFGEDVQIGRQDHPTTWVSTNPFQYLNAKLFDVGTDFPGGEQYDAFRSHLAGRVAATKAKHTKIGNDVWIGHGAFVRAGVTIGDGAIVAARAVVAKDVPPYSIVAGNPAQVKRYRMSEDMIAAMAEAAWWRFAPWDLQGLPFNEPPAFLDALREREAGLRPYRAQRLRLADLSASLDVGV